MNALRRSLETVLQSEQILGSDIERIAFANDASCYRLVPQAVVRPRSLEEIRALFRWSHATKIPLCFRAAGTSLSGQAITDGVLVDLSRDWNEIQVENGGQQVRVQCGVVGSKVNDYLRRYGTKLGPDPASIGAAMIGGIVANNASGMCCGVAQNSYHTLKSMIFVLPDGTTINTADLTANEQLVEQLPRIANGLLELRHEILASPALVEKIRRKYQIKNTVGYSLNAFLDFATPVEILRHLLIGSEGTLGFIAETTFDTVPDHRLKYTGLLFFQSVPEACASIIALRDSGAAALELMDYACLRAMKDQQGAPKELIQSLPDSSCALLVEYQASGREELETFKSRAAETIGTLPVIQTLPFSEDYKVQATLWKLRKGIIPVVSAVRPPGTTVINEDIAFPLEHLAAGIAALQLLFIKHRYPDGVIFGHAKDGNLHFTIAQSFNTEADIRQFEGLMTDLAELVAGQYGGSLKAEHGTGRNMAPFVEMEWGREAYSIMCRLKALIDPENLLNPGVIINDDNTIHLKNLKPIPVVEDVINNCIECGWCENKCPSHGLTLSPRQRIVVWREITRLEATAAKKDRESARTLRQEYQYNAVDTCATDGLCATVCPVHINTGDMMKLLREQSHSARSERIAQRIANNFSRIEALLTVGVRIGHRISKVGGVPLLQGLSRLVSRLSGVLLPQWNQFLGAPSRLPVTQERGADAVYFPACVTRMMGTPHDEHQSPVEILVTVAERAGLTLWIPTDCTHHCCGTPFSSKGFHEAYHQTIERTINRMWQWSEGGTIPIITDSSSCAYTFKECMSELSGTTLERYQQLRIMDSIQFTDEVIIPRLKEQNLLNPIDETVVIHPVCSVVKMGLQDQLHNIVHQCSAEAVFPINAGCCGFAGDRGMLAPELTANATRRESEEVREREYAGYYSSNPPCEAAMTGAVGKPYRSYLYLLERATRGV